jgi:hypothetical protein
MASLAYLSTSRHLLEPSFAKMSQAGKDEIMIDPHLAGGQATKVRLCLRHNCRARLIQRLLYCA